jgi:aryl-alcohol dehydrogenase-like predicted oxidoreductase
MNGTPEYTRIAIEKSLKRLGVETIDLWYLQVCVILRIQAVLTA